MTDKGRNNWDDPGDLSAQALRDALRRLDAPEVSADFDAKVLAAVRGHSPWWELFVSYLRPAMATATASAVVTMVLLSWPAHPSRPAVAAAEDAARARQEAAVRIDRALRDPKPTYGALMPLRALGPEPTAPAPKHRAHTPAPWWKLRWPGA